MDFHGHQISTSGQSAATVPTLSGKGFQQVVPVQEVSWPFCCNSRPHLALDHCEYGGQQDLLNFNNAGDEGASNT